jgi:hypothetical protein
MSYLYDATTGEYLGRASDEQDGEGAARSGKPFLVHWKPESCLHGRVLDDEPLPAWFANVRKVCVLDTPHYYLAPFNGRLVWQYDV